MIAKKILSYAIMEIFAFKVGVGPKGPQQYLLGLSWASDNDKTDF